MQNQPLEHAHFEMAVAVTAAPTALSPTRLQAVALPVDGPRARAEARVIRALPLLIRSFAAL